MIARSLFGSLVLSIAISGGVAQAMPLAPSPVPEQTLVAPASFWAKPYPYGYRWRKTPCVRTVPSCTEAVVAVPACEVRWKRVVVCR
ncbi:hypothetical protein [Rhodoplanes sp. SY1]|uniref:hypothetical protein n=1 Tax=Rhodoplanes sp. SY1 TaxID=3166646 RepID=UPI0038B50F76